MHSYSYLTPSEAFKGLYKQINFLPESDNGTKRLRNVAFKIYIPGDKVIDVEKRKFKEEYAEYEWEWYLSGNRDASEIAEKAKIWKNMFVEDTTEVNSNYGYFWKLNDQYDRVKKELSENPKSRRAVIVHYDIHELDRYKYDTPCNVVLNFYIDRNNLHLTVFARSMDLWFGFCNDQYTFAKLQEKLAKELGLRMGSSNYFITDLHLYSRHFDKL